MKTNSELKEIIVRLKMDLLKMQIPRGYCPYTYYTPINGKKISCIIDCDKCWEDFMNRREEIIRAEVRSL